MVYDIAKEVMKNIHDFVMSYNFDDSDYMTDYFNTNLYLHLGIGTYKKPYKLELPKLDCKGKKPKAFKHPEGAAHKAIRQALGNARFGFYEANDIKGKLYSERIHTDAMETNTSIRYPIRVPELHRNESTNWGMQAYVANSPAITEVTLNFSVTHPRRRPCSRKNVKTLLSHGRNGRKSLTESNNNVDIFLHKKYYKQTVFSNIIKYSNRQLTILVVSFIFVVKLIIFDNFSLHN